MFNFNFAEGMQHIADDIIKSFDERINDVQKIKNNAHKFINKCQKDHKDMAKKQRENLHAFTNNLKEKVRNQQKEFSKEQKAVHNEIEKGHQVFQDTVKKMANKRKNAFNFEKHSIKAMQKH
jgi:hypothetical protein